MIASFPMYDLDEVRAHTDALWRAIAAEIRGASRSRRLSVPEALTRPAGDLLEHWLRTDIVLSHTCGYPVANSFTPLQHVLGSFDVATGEPGVPGWYRSVIVCREDDHRIHGPEKRGITAFDGAIAAVNDEGSLSGWVSLGWAMAEAGATAGSIVLSGSHVESARIVRNGTADLASLDAHTLALLRAHRPVAVEGLHVVARGPLVAVTPLFTAHVALVDVLRESISAAVARLDQSSRDALQLRGWVPHDRDAHEGVVAMAERARHGLPGGGN